mmetsp:Transcript_2426/g.6180  ORF Transcript_2426/g.6180 Transcript_2426/m.6180 type:complete len:1385 (-) Transcript_2426:794-4948(-)
MLRISGPHHLGIRQPRARLKGYKPSKTNLVHINRHTLQCYSVLSTVPASTALEIARRALEANGGLSASTSIIQQAPHGATMWLTSVCFLSVCLGALSYSLMSKIQQLLELQSAGARAQEKRQICYGVDVTGSRFFQDDRVLAAMEFAAKAHAGQVRKTGEPYVSHCIETALIVEHNLPPAAEYDRYTLAMMASLLHDVVDDTAVDIAAIHAEFGPAVASMVAKVSKLSQMNQLLRRGKRKGWAEYSPQHFKSLRKMIVDMVFEEPLVILIKLADRLHNMRTVFVLKPDKQRAVAEETLEVWCTMAECLGWDALKSEMEDLCFAVLQPEQYCALRAQLDRIWALPSLKVVVEQADSASLPANALAPAPPLTARGRRAAAAAEARRVAASERRQQVQAALLVAQGPGPTALESVDDTDVLRAARMHQMAMAAASAGRQGGAGSATALARPPPTSLATAAPTMTSAASASSQQMDDGDDHLNLGIRIVSCPRDAGSAAADDLPCGAGPVSSGCTTSWDLVSWKAGSSASPGPETDVSVQSLRSLPSGSSSSGGSSGVGAESAAVAGPTDSVVSEADMEELQRQLQRLQSHAGAGPGPHSEATPAPAASGAGAGAGGSPATAMATATAVLAGARASSAAAAATAAQAATSSQAAAARASAAAVLDQLKRQQLMGSDTEDAGLSGPDGSPSPPPPPPPPKGSPRPTRFLPPGLAAFMPLLGSGAQVGLQVLPQGAAASSTGGGSGGGGKGGQGGGGGGGTGPAVAAKPLSEQQERLRSLISTVVPFDSVNFKDTRGLAISMRRGLEVLDECAELLYAEVTLRSAVGGLQLTIQGRLKSLNSVYRKMVRKGCSVAQVYDARALRVIVGDEGGARARDAVEAAYKLVSVVHSIWKPIPQEFDDYIANPKPSGYQALHTAVKGPGGIPMEVQIKTASMHHLAEYGAAAHWVYKEYAGGVAPISDPSSRISAPAHAPAQQQQDQHQQQPPAPPQQPPAPQLWANPIVVPTLSLATPLPPTQPSPALHTAASGSGAPAAVAPAARPPPKPRGKGWVGQPVLRIAKDKLRYGVVVVSEDAGRRLVVGVRAGPTSEAYPTRVPDYAFYRSMAAYSNERGWVVPGHGDFNLRLEEFVMANDGRLHRKDHMGYVMPAETLTLLEGYEEDADAWEAAEAALQQATHAHIAAEQLPQLVQVAAERGTGLGMHHHAHGKGAPVAAAVAAAVREGESGGEEEEGGEPSAPAPPVDPAAERFRRQMQEAYLRTQQLRTMIEWGRAAMGRYHPGGCEPGDEVSVLIWPGGSIEHWPRGTRVSEVVRAKGIITLGGGSAGGAREPREVRPSATSLAGGEDGWLTAGSSSPMAGKPLVNVNNRLVPEDTALNDGDLVILTREKVKI